MKCERVRDLVSDALDGVLGDHVADRFHHHLDECPPCQTYYTELKESLLLLEEIPVIEVDDSFDRAVWAQIRAEEEPRSIVDLVRERVEMLRVRFSFDTGLWRWSPVGVAAALLIGLAVSFDSDGVPVVAQVEPLSEPSGLEARRSSLRTETNAEVAATTFEEEEFVSEMPQAIEAFLRNGQDLRLKNSEKYEHSNYSYPLRRIPDPTQGRTVGYSVRRGSSMRTGTPVGATVPVQNSSGVTVLAF